MTTLRVILVALVIALGTVLLGWWAVPVVAAAYGVVARRSRFPGLVAAAGAALAWGGYLGVAALGGAPVESFSPSLAASMQLPAWAPFMATLAFPALLAAPAAYLGARVMGRYLPPS